MIGARFQLGKFFTARKTKIYKDTTVKTIYLSVRQKSTKKNVFNAFINLLVNSSSSSISASLANSSGVFFLRINGLAGSSSTGSGSSSFFLMLYYENEKQKQNDDNYYYDNEVHYNNYIVMREENEKN